MSEETVVSTPAPAVPATESAPAPAAPASSEAPASTEAPATTEGSETPVAEYKPDYKLKVYDEEKELDDPFLKNLIKDADSEKKVKEIAQKYLGFDTLKGKNEGLRNEFKQYQEIATPVIQYYNHASQLLAKNDLDSFFDLIKVPQDTIFKWAVKKAEEMQLPEHQRAQIEQQRKVEREREYFQGQNQSLQSTQQKQMGEFRNKELNFVLQRPDVKSVADAFEAKNGAGSFRNLVAEKGLAHHYKTNGQEDLSAEQAVQEVMKLIGGFVTPTTPVTQPGQALIPQGGGQPPIIPNVGSRGTSAVKKQVRSIADLKQKRNEILQAGSS